MTSWINRSDEALMDMRKKPATAPGANSSESTMIPPQIQGWLLLHRARSRDQDIVGVMTMTGGSLNIKLVEKSLLDLFTDDVLQSVDRSHGKDSGNPRKQHAFEAEVSYLVIADMFENPEDDWLATASSWARARVEVHIKKLAAEERAQFRAAQRKEMDQWISNDVISVCQRAGIPKQGVMTMRGKELFVT